MVKPNAAQQAFVFARLDRLRQLEQLSKDIAGLELRKVGTLQEREDLRRHVDALLLATSAQLLAMVLTPDRADGGVVH